MTLYRIGNLQTLESNLRNNGNNQPPGRKLLVEFSSDQDRANLVSMTAGLVRRRRAGSRRRPQTRGSRSKARTTRIRVVRGQVALRVGGYPGVQHVGASQLVRFVPLNKLRAAAKKALGSNRRRGGSRRRRVRRRRKGRVSKGSRGGLTTGGNRRTRRQRRRAV